MIRPDSSFVLKLLASCITFCRYYELNGCLSYGIFHSNLLSLGDVICEILWLNSKRLNCCHSIELSVCQHHHFVFHDNCSQEKSIFLTNRKLFKAKWSNHARYFFILLFYDINSLFKFRNLSDLIESIDLISLIRSFLWLNNNLEFCLDLIHEFQHSMTPFLTFVFGLVKPKHIHETKALLMLWTRNDWSDSSIIIAQTARRRGTRSSSGGSSGRMRRRWWIEAQVIENVNKKRGTLLILAGWTMASVTPAARGRWNN